MLARTQAPEPSAGSTANTIRAEFPLLAEPRRAGALHYLDNAATTHKPRAVIDAEVDCYRSSYAPVHRGLYALAETATANYENARATLARFIGAGAPGQLIFTRSTTEAINMVAHGWARPRLKPGDAIWVTRMEHHANFLPWQRVCRETGANLRIIELTPDGELDLARSDDIFGNRTRLIAVTHISNVLGTVNPIDQIVERARVKRIPVLIDAAQSVSHARVDVAEWGCDFLAFSAHKMYGPTGIGALYGSAERLEETEPLLLGGGMVDDVNDAVSVWAPLPARLEAGSPNLAGAVGFAAAAEFLTTRIGMARAYAEVQSLTDYLVETLRRLPGVTVYGPSEPSRRSGIAAFNAAGIHAHDVAQTAGESGVAIRAGHHCCLPLHRRLGIAASARASVAVYNTRRDIEALADAVERARKIFG